MKATLTVYGPIGVQREVEHKASSFKQCLRETVADMKELSSFVDEQSQKDWKKIEVTIER